MTDERGEAVGGKGAKAQKFLGSLKDALMAASRDDTMPAAKDAAKAVPVAVMATPSVLKDGAEKVAGTAALGADEAARLARAAPVSDQGPEADAPPTTRVLRRENPRAAVRTVLIRGKQKFEHASFQQDPVVGFLVVVGGPGLGAFKPIFEGNNSIGRTDVNRIPLNFGDDSISAEEQAYLRYDSADRSFLFVPNLAKTNVVSVNDKRPTGAVELKSMDVIVLGRTQVAFLPFCGADFDWSEISDT